MGHTATVATLEVTMSGRLAAIVAALAMTLVLAAQVAAGGWAEIVAEVLAAERDALAQQVAAAVERAPVGSDSMPVMAVITLAVLAGAAAGFATAWLGNRPGPRVTLSPAPREADPA